LIGELVDLREQALEGRLAAYVESQWPDQPSVVVEGRLSGGWSVSTYAVAIGGRRLVLRVADPDHPTQTSPANEARVLPHAAEAGVPVPELACIEDDPSWLGGPFSLVQNMPGAAPNVWSTRSMDHLLADANGEGILAQIAELALRVAGIPASAVADSPPSTMSMRPEGYTIVSDALRWRDALGRTEFARPLLQLGARWLLENPPAAQPVVFQHHDFRLGNMLFLSDGTVSAVLDWEFAGAGDPRCDIGYAAQPYVLGRLLHRAPALGTIRDPTTWLLDAFAERAPTLGQRDELRYFVALGILKMAVSLVRIVDAQSGQPDAGAGRWLEMPILSLTDDLVTAIRGIR
jgi:aminoglycoside phosphotransferase (APT) family kinase protein